MNRYHFLDRCFVDDVYFAGHLCLLECALAKPCNCYVSNCSYSYLLFSFFGMYHMRRFESMDAEICSL